MSSKVTAREVYVMLRANLRSRPDIGLCKAVADRLLEPANPFQPERRRAPQKWFVLSLVIVAATAASFLFFNLSH